MYHCDECDINIPINQKTIHLRQNHFSSCDDYSKYYVLAKKCSKLYIDVINKINEINKIEGEILELNPNKALVQKKWFKEYIYNRDTFLDTVSNIAYASKSK